IASLQQTVEMDPGFARAHQTLAIMYRSVGKFDEAVREFVTEDSLLGRRSAAEREAWYGPLRRAYHSGGERAYYAQLVRQRREVARTKPVTPMNFAGAFAMIGEADSAFYYLERARDQHDPLVLRIQVEPIWNNLRRDPRYKPFVRSLGYEGS